MSCLEQLEVLYDKDTHIQNMIDTGYGGLEKLKTDILFDFFRSAFDGSGADNFFDAGRYLTHQRHLNIARRRIVYVTAHGRTEQCRPL